MTVSKSVQKRLAAQQQPIVSAVLWYPRDASFWSTRDTNANHPKKYHLMGASWKSLCGGVMVAEDIPVSDPRESLCCKRCLRIVRASR